MNRFYFLVTIVFSLLILLLPQRVFAQGTYSCAPTGAGCTYFISCDPGCGPGSCTPCSGTHQCICQSQLDWNDLLQTSLPNFFSASGTYSRTGDIVSALVNYLFPIAGLLLMLYLLYGGFVFLTSAGDPQKVQTAKGILTMAFIGFAIIFTSYWIVQIVSRVLGLPDIQSIF